MSDKKFVLLSCCAISFGTIAIRLAIDHIPFPWDGAVIGLVIYLAMRLGRQSRDPH